MKDGEGPNKPLPFSMTAYEKVKAAKLAILEGKPRPEECPLDVWEVLLDMYDKKNR
jgi:hypothetical protein